MVEGKAAFITGAASGIGRATAELFAEQGFWIGAADRNVAGLEALRAELGRDQCRTWRLDVADKAAYDKVIDEVAEETGGRLDLLFNNAGIAVAGFFEDIPIEETRRVIEVNLGGVINGIYAALPLLKETRMNHLGKLMFQSFYWHSLLPGRNIPGIGHEMPTSGKQNVST